MCLLHWYSRHKWGLSEANHFSYVGIWKQKIPGKGKSKYEGPKAGVYIELKGPARMPQVLELSEQGIVQEEKKRNHFVRGLEGHGMNLSICSKWNGGFYHRSDMTQLVLKG